MTMGETGAESDQRGKGCGYYAGWVLAGLGLLALPGLIADLFTVGSGEWSDVVGGTLLAVMMVVGGVLLVRRGFRASNVDPTQSESLERQVLTLASENGGWISVPQVAARTELSLADSDRMLTRLAKEGFARMEVDEEGDTRYVFPGLDDRGSAGEAGEEWALEEEVAAAVDAAELEYERSGES